MLLIRTLSSRVVDCCVIPILLCAESTKPGVNVTMMSIEPEKNNDDLNEDLGILATEAMPIELCNQVCMLFARSRPWVGTSQDSGKLRG